MTEPAEDFFTHGGHRYRVVTNARDGFLCAREGQLIYASSTRGPEVEPLSMPHDLVFFPEETVRRHLPGRFRPD